MWAEVQMAEVCGWSGKCTYNLCIFSWVLTSSHWITKSSSTLSTKHFGILMGKNFQFCNWGHWKQFNLCPFDITSSFLKHSIIFCCKKMFQAHLIISLLQSCSQPTSWRVLILLSGNGIRYAPAKWSSPILWSELGNVCFFGSWVIPLGPAYHHRAFPLPPCGKFVYSFPYNIGCNS